MSLILSWYEQKAVVILLSLLYLGIRNIRLGPSLPAFVTPAVLQVLVDKFAIRPIGTAEEDLAAILGTAPSRPGYQNAATTGPSHSGGSGWHPTAGAVPGGFSGRLPRSPMIAIMAGGVHGSAPCVSGFQPGRYGHEHDPR